MEGNSQPGRILCSEKTNDLIVAAGKEHWMSRRQDLVVAKGKGKMQCFWCEPKSDISGHLSINDQACIPSSSSVYEDPAPVVEPRGQDAEVDWVVEVFEVMLHTLMASRELSSESDDKVFAESESYLILPRDEVSEIITLSDGEARTHRKLTKKEVKLKKIVRKQLRKYICTIAKLYRDNPFHNFQHACHVVMATKKLLLRVIKPGDSAISSTAYGITSDPLTQFAIVFSALIHDVDHPGVSNAQLVKEDASIAKMYNNLSVAEQNSITIAWKLLMQPKFVNLRHTIMPTEADSKLFRKIIVNSVMATDLFDKDLKTLRENRWNKAFAEGVCLLSHEDDYNRRATIVIEHIIQASDVSHTMQHWQVYQTWNRKLFRELHQAYIDGRCEKDPVAGWYDGELWFFDNYIIPLAKKLKTCGVFGVSCDELLDYATDNRAEWAIKGKDIVAELVALTNARPSTTRTDDKACSSPRERRPSILTQKSKKKTNSTKEPTRTKAVVPVPTEMTALTGIKLVSNIEDQDTNINPEIDVSIPLFPDKNHDDSIMIEFDSSINTDVEDIEIKVVLNPSNNGACTGLFETWPTISSNKTKDDTSKS
jgi:3'5'-cyclic nucleotide phosphodiesterase